MAAKSSTEENQEHERCSPLAFVSTAALHNASSLFYRFANFLKMVKEETLPVVLGKDGEGGVPWVDLPSNATTEKRTMISLRYIMRIHFESRIDSRILETVVKRAFRGHSNCSFYR